MEITNSQEKLFKAISYIIETKAEVPDNMSGLINEISEYDTIGRNINKAIAKTEETLGELNDKAQQTIGSIDTILKMLIKVTPEDIIEKYSAKFKEENKADKKEQL